MGQGFCKNGHDQVKELQEMLIKIDETKHYQKLKTYQGLSSIFNNLQDLVYRLYPKNFENFQRIMNICNSMKKRNNNFLCELIYAICLIQKEEYIKAEELLHYIIEMYPGFAHPYFFLGNISLLKDSRKNAVQFYNECIKLDPLNNEAILLYDQCKIKMFDPLYDDILEKSPKLAQEVKILEGKALIIHSNDKRCFQAFHIVSSNQQSEQSIKQCNQYLKHLPNCFGANIKKAQIYMTKNDFTKAIQYFQKGMELKPYSWSPLSSLAIIYYVQNQLDVSLSYCNKIIESQLIMNESNKKAMQISIKIKILCLQGLGRVDESLNVCNTNLYKSNFEKDFLHLKSQILATMEKFKTSQIVKQQIDIQINKQNLLRKTQLNLLVFEKYIKDTMIMNPKHVFFDIYFELNE